MACNAGPDIIEDGLVLCLDAANINSYPKSGTTWSDLAGSNNGTLTNGPTFDDENGGSIVFDGSDDIVNIGNLGTTMYNASCWVYLNSTRSTSGKMSLFQYGETGNSQPGITFGSVTGYFSNETLTMLWGSGSTYKRTAVRGDISAGWNYLVFNWNGVTYDIVINNVARTTITGGYGHLPLVTINDLVLGYGYSQSYEFTGRIGSFSTYNRALSADEIRQNYLSTKERYA